MNAIAKRLLWLLVLVFLGQRLSGLFVQAYMWQQGGSLSSLSRFNMAVYLGGAVAFLILGAAVKRGRSILAFRIGLALQAAFFVAVLLLGERSGWWLTPLGLLSGLGSGAFWAGQNMMIQESISAADRGRYWGYAGAVASAMALLGPLSGGWMITALGDGAGYRLIFLSAAASFGLAWALSQGISPVPTDSPYRLLDGLWDHSPYHRWGRVLSAHLFTGFRDGILAFLPAVLVYASTGDALAMGNFAVITNAAGLVANWAVGRFVRPGRRFGAMLVSGLLQATSALVLLARLDYGTLLIYTLSNALFGPLQGVPFLALTFDAIADAGRDRQVERMVVREISLVIGRAGGMLLLLGLSLGYGAEQTSTIALALVALVALVPVLVLGPRSDHPDSI